MKDFIIGLKVQSGTIWPLILFEDKIHRRATVFLKTAASFPVEFVLISSLHSADLLKRQKVKDDECSWSVLGKTDIILSENDGTEKTAVVFSFKRQQGGPLQVDIRSEDGSFHQTLELPVSENVAVHDVRFPYGTFELQKIPLTPSENTAASISETDISEVAKESESGKNVNLENLSVENIPDAAITQNIVDTNSVSAENCVFKTRYTIGFKLVTIISFIVIISCSLITVLVNRFVSQDVRISAEENNLAINLRTSFGVQERLSSVKDSVEGLLRLRDVNLQSEMDVSLFDEYLDVFAEKNRDIYAIEIGGDTVLLNKNYAGSMVNSSMVKTVRDHFTDSLKRAEKGEVCIENVSPFFEHYMLALMYPFAGNSENQAVMILFDGSRLGESLESESTNVSFMVNNEGYVLYHPDDNLVLAAANLSDMPLVKDMMMASEINMQRLFTGKDGIEYFGAYNKLPAYGDASVMTLIESSVVFESVQATTRRNIYLSVAVLALAILFVWFFAKTMSVPVKILAAASRKIQKGEFELDLKPRTHDELGLLTESFVSMGHGLAERERLKDTFGRFTNPAVAEQAMRGELELGGETKDVTVFFSDIRSFTAISEKLSPSDVVSFLNEYMTRMVECVNLTNGVVDKFIGDAVMAVWGAPVSAGNSAADALNCVRAALMMRHSLMEFNVGRGSERKPIIRIGCGINTGAVVAGQIGSEKRMEYTVIGDTVNFASRTESLNKPLGTDILITENTYLLIKDKVLVEEMPSVTVKGKEKPVRIYAVINMPEASDIPGAGPEGPQTLSQVRQLLGIPEPDLRGVNLDAEEKKYTIQN